MHGQAKQLYNEAEGAIRAMLNLKDLLKHKEKSDAEEELIKEKVEDARMWCSFMELDEGEKRLCLKEGLQDPEGDCCTG